MNILVHGINYHPESVGIGQYTTDLCEHLVSRGHEVTVVTALPYYPWWRVPPPYRGRFLVEEERNGVRILRTWLYVPRRVTSVGRVLHELSFTALSTLRLLSLRRRDLLLTVSPPLFLGIAARLWSTLHRRPYVFSVQDLQPDAAADLGMLGGSLPARAALAALFRMERWIYEGSALTTVLTEGMRRMVLDKGVAPGRVEVVPDWVDAGRLRPVDPRPFRERHALDGRFVVLHAGNMGVKQGLGTVLEAADRLRGEQDVLFLLVGEGACRDALVGEAGRRGLANVRFLPLQPVSEVAAMHSAADLCLLSQRPEVSDIVMPCKVLGIMACGRPLLASAHHGTEVARTVQESGGGVLVEPGNAASLVRAVRFARDHPESRRAWGEAGRRYALRRWDRAVVLPAFEERLLEVAVS